MLPMKIGRYLGIFILIFSMATAANLESQISVKVINSTAVQVCWTLPARPIPFGNLQLALNRTENTNIMKTQVKNIPPIGNSCTFENIIAGGKYSISLTTIEHGLKRTVSSTSLFSIKPSPPTNLDITDVAETSAWLNYEPPLPPGIFSHYHVVLDPPNINGLSAFDFRQNRMRFDDLKEGTTYRVSVQTVSSTVLSNPVKIEFTTLQPLAKKGFTPMLRSTPALVVNFKNSSTSNSFILSWDLPNTFDFDNYELVLKSPNFYQKSVIHKQVTWWEVHNLDFKIKYQLIFQKIPKKVDQQFVAANVTFFSDHFFVDMNGATTVVPTEF